MLMKKLFKNWAVLPVAVLTFALIVSCDEDDPAPIVPTAAFSYDNSDFTVTFTNESENAVSFSWDFGDDSGTSTDVSPEYTYDAYGTYPVTLTVTSEEGETDETTVNVEVVDKCDIWDGSQTDNLLIGGGFEECDDKYWTTYKVGEPQHTKFEFGYVDYNPSAGTDGALYIYPDNDDTDENEATLFWQKVTGLDAGNYSLDALIKLKGENQADPTSGMTDYWFQLYVGTTEPTDGSDYADGQVSGWFYGAWTGWAYENSSN